MRKSRISVGTLALLGFGVAVAVGAGAAPVVPRGALWRYYKGYSTPSAQGTNQWFQPGFSDSGWGAASPSGFGYGDSDDATDLSDMMGAYASLFIRTTFQLADTASVTRLNLRADYDDGFVAYLNGVEVARRNMPTGAVTHATLAVVDHEAACSTNAPDVGESEWIAIPASALRNGTNVLAVSGHNVSLGSSDFSLTVEVFTNVSLVRGPYLQFPDTQTVSIIWRTAAEVDTVFAYGADTNCSTIVSNAVPTRDHEVALTNLPPGAQLYYRISGGGESLRGPTPLRTPRAAGTPIRLAVIGDFGTPETGALAVAACVCTQSVDALLTVGDNVYPIGCSSEYDPLWFGPYADLMARVPTFPAVGNHDQYVENARWFQANFRLPTNGPAGWLERVYSTDIGDAHVTVIDTEPFALGDAPAVAAITSWMTNDLAHAQASIWRIVILHRPPRTSVGGHDEQLAVRGATEPYLHQYGVDLVLQGHNHWYERLNPIDGVHYVTVGAGGRPLYDVSSLQPYSAVLVNDRFGFSLIDIDGSRLTLREVGSDGVAYDAVSWDKSRFRMDGLLDSPAWGRATNGLVLSAAIRGPDLYVATADAGEGSDHFIYLASQLSSNRPANWTKGGLVMQWSALLADENENGFHQWMGPDGETWLNDFRHYRHVTSGLDDTGTNGNGVLEGTIDLANHFGSFPPVIYLAAAPYATTNNGHLFAASQVPAGNGDADINAGEFLALPTRLLALDLPVAAAGTGGTVEAGMAFPLDGSASASPSQIPLRFAWSVPPGAPAALGAPTNTVCPLVATQQIGAVTTVVASLAVHDGRFGETSTVAVTVVPWLDSDGDGLSDQEELTGTDNLLTAIQPEGRTSDPLRADSDSDGVPDGAEAIAGTDPNVTASRPGFVSAFRSADEIVFTWPSATGRYYRIGAASNLSAGFTPLTPDLDAVPPLNVWTLAPPGALQFFQLETHK